ncbi:hypothetical protein [Bifidobacterium sp. AGR2158]|uniref:hypothetical protein n=1 Tax=Bifidobacterium sp. AGR2158 TaxID=1280675 RepID=UPI0003F71962|nr:hypothetical protein [Bifidobacterium sp. AGR2158]
MSIEAFATPDELGEWLGEPITDEHDVKRAARILRAASNLIRRYTACSWAGDEVPADGLPEELNDVALSCAARYYVNPNGETQWTRQIDDAMDGGSRKVEQSGLYLTADEKSILDSVRPPSDSVIAGVGTVHTTRGDFDGYEGDGFPWWTLTGSETS